MNGLNRMVKGFLNALWGVRKASLSKRIIYYHSIHPQTPRSVTPEVFQSHLAWLKANGFGSILVRDIPKALRQPELFPSPWVAITFDDGYQDNIEHALPILEKTGFVATFFVVAGFAVNTVGNNSCEGHMLYENRPMMNADHLRRLCSEGMEIGSHTLTHRQVTRVVEISSKAAEDDLRQSKEVLEHATGCSVTSFSYPNGQRGAFSDSTRELVQQTGYRIAATTMWGTPTAGADLLALPRCEISARDHLDDFKAKMQGLRDYNRYICLLLKRANLWDAEERCRMTQADGAVS